MNNPYAEKIAQFLEDEAMMLAVREILEAQFNLNSAVSASPLLANEQLGELTRSCIQGAQFLKNGFKELEKYRKEKVVEKTEVNPAV